MTNSEVTQTEATYASALIVDAPVLMEGIATPDDPEWDGGEEVQSEPKFTEVEATYSLPREGELYRYLSWVSKIRGAVSLTSYSEARQTGVAVLVDHGLVNERQFIAGSRAGRSTFRVTGAGEIALAAARSAANEVLIG